MLACWAQARPTLPRSTFSGLVPTLVGGLCSTPSTIPRDAELLLGWLGVATACILGHLFPVWLRFKGRQGRRDEFPAMLGVFQSSPSRCWGAAVVRAFRPG